MKFYKIDMLKKTNAKKIEAVISGIERFDCTQHDSICWHPTSEMYVKLSKSGKIFRDTLYDGHWKQFFIISEQLVNDIELFYEFKINDLYSIKFDQVQLNSFTNKVIPQYFVINYRNIYGLKIDLIHFPYPNPIICRSCNSTLYDREEFVRDMVSGKIKERYYDIQSWNGNELFSFGTNGIGCTENLMKYLVSKYNDLFEFNELKIFA